MQIKNYAITLPTAGALAAVSLLTACGGGSSHSTAGITTSSAAAQAATAVAVTQQDDSNWAGYLVASSATTKTSFSAVSGSWTQPTADCSAGSRLDDLSGFPNCPVPATSHFVRTSKSTRSPADTSRSVR
jgi:hypothetical protein